MLSSARKVLLHAIRKNGLKTLLFYLNNLDTNRFIEYSKTLQFVKDIKHSKVKHSKLIVLDCGSGYSILPELLQTELNDSLYLCLDIRAGPCKYQQNRNKNIDSIRADMRYLPFKDSSIPILIAISSIEHVPDDVSVFQEISRVISKDGLAIISFGFSIQREKIKQIKHSPILIKLLYKFKKFWALILGEQHMEYFIGQTSIDTFEKIYNKDSIMRILNYCGLVVEESYLFSKFLLSKFHKVLPMGWFILKDFFFGLFLWKIEDLFLKRSENANQIIMKVRKVLDLNPDNKPASLDLQSNQPQVKNKNQGISLKVSAIIPTFNEESNLPCILPKIAFYVNEIILVDAYSTDNTVAVAKKLCPSARIFYQSGKGKGDALRCGFKNSTGDILITIDADGSHDPEEIPRFIDLLTKGYDYVKGSRFLPGGGTSDMPWYRRFGNKIFIILSNILYGTKYTDLCYGYNAFWRKALEGIEIKSDGFEIETEINIKVKKAGLKVIEVPSFEKKRYSGIGGLRSLTDGWRILKTILRLKFS